MRLDKIRLPQRERDNATAVLRGVVALIYLASFIPAIFWLIG